ncbi:MAG: ribosome hibernation-promoting factor, HPF/YfiA family [Bacteroidia bacterium]
MDIKIQSIHFDADKKLIAFIEEKVKKLAKYHDGIIGAEVFLRLEKNSEKENKITEIKLLVPGSDVFAKRQCTTFEEATDLSVEAIATQLKKQKEKARGM